MGRKKDLNGENYIYVSFFDIFSLDELVLPFFFCFFSSRLDFKERDLNRALSGKNNIIRGLIIREMIK